MNKLRPIEKLMTLSARSKNASYTLAFKRMVTVYRFIDRKNHTNHCQIINFLYNGNKKKNLTYLAIARMLNTSDNALRRYRQDYTDWFCYYLNLENADTAA